VGAILAGGKSTRMGQDKAELSVEGSSLLEQMFSRLKEASFIHEVIVSGNYPAYPHLVDKVENCGPLGGLYTLLSNYAEGSLLFLVPVDVPRFSSELLGRLASLAKNTQSDAYYFKGNTLPAIFRVSERLRSLVKERVEAKNGLSVRQLLSEIDAVEISIEDSQKDKFSNINFPDQWESYRNEYQNKKQSSSL
jgi:molybdopterin-guanine dinucleotide biosynthesis protein A